MVLNWFRGRKAVKVEMDDGTHKVVSMVEGSGVYTCDLHRFITEDINEWKIHKKTEQHSSSRGSHRKCIVCNHSIVDISGHPAGESPICVTCEDRLNKSRDRVKAKLEADSKKGGKK